VTHQKKNSEIYKYKKKQQKKMLKRKSSPSPPRTLKKTIKITNIQRHQLKKLKKQDLQKLSGLVGEKLNANDTKADIAHRLARNKKIGIALSSAIAVPLLLSFKHFYDTKKQQNQEKRKNQQALQTRITTKLDPILTRLTTNYNQSMNTISGSNMKERDKLRAMYEATLTYEKNVKVATDNVTDEETRNFTPIIYLPY
jgi:hypothetical protein